MKKPIKNRLVITLETEFKSPFQREVNYRIVVAMMQGLALRIMAVNGNKCKIDSSVSGDSIEEAAEIIKKVTNEDLEITTL